MSFGFSIGDIVALVALTKKTYDSWRDAPKEYADVVQTLSESNILLRHVEHRFDTLIGTETNAGKQKEIGVLLRGCEKTVSELRTVIKRRRNLGHWDRFRLGTGASHVNDLKNRLARHINTITPFLFSLELESIGKDINSLPATLNRLPQMLSNALPAALGKMIDQRIEESRTVRGSVMTTYGDDDDKQAYKELRRNLRSFGIKDSVVRQQRTKLVEFVRSLTHDGHNTTVNDTDGDRQSLGEQPVLSPSPMLVSQVVHAAEDTETVCAKNASRTSYNQYPVSAKQHDEDGSTKSVVADPSNRNTATRPERTKRDTGDSKHRTHIFDNTENNEPEATRKTRESTTGVASRRKYQAYMETEDEDCSLETSQAVLDDFSNSWVCSESSQKTRTNTGGEQKSSTPNDLDHDTLRRKLDGKSEFNSKARGTALPPDFSGVSEQSAVEKKANHTSGKTGRPVTRLKLKPSSTFADCGDLEYQKCLGSSSESDSTASVATHASCDGYCSSYSQLPECESDDQWELLSESDQRWSDYEQRSDSEVGDYASKTAHSGGTDDEEECSKRHTQKRSPPTRKTTTKPTRRSAKPEPPSSFSSPSPSPSVPDVEGTATRSRPPLRMIEYKPLDAEKEGRLTIQLHMPAGFSVHVEGGRTAQFQDRRAPPTRRQYFPSLPRYEQYWDYYANCFHGFPNAPRLGRAGGCECQVVCWTPDLQIWNPRFVDGLREWALHANGISADGMIL